MLTGCVSLIIRITYGYTDNFMFFDVWRINDELVYIHRAGKILDLYESKANLIMRLIDNNLHTTAYYMLLFDN
jgi:hypothetical protein